MTRLLQRLRENDESLTVLEESDLSAAFRDELNVIKDCNRKGETQQADALTRGIMDRLERAVKQNASIVKVKLKSAQFFGAFGNLDKLQEFSLDSNKFKTVRSIVLRSILRNKGLQKLRLRRCLVAGHPSAFAEFLAELRYHPSLEVFEFIGSDLRELYEGIRYRLAPLLLALCTIPKLKTVEFSVENISTDALHPLSFDVISALYQLRSLERLTLLDGAGQRNVPIIQFHDPDGIPDYIVWASPLKSNRNLKHLAVDVSWLTGADAELVRAVNFCGTIESLELCYRNFSSAALCADLAEYLQNRGSLKHLTFTSGFFEEAEAVFESLADFNLGRY